MFIQLEHGESLSAADIIGVFDLETIGVNDSVNMLFNRKQQQHGVVNLAADIPKSFVLAVDDYDDSVYLSGLSTESIKKRAEKQVFEP